MPCCNPPDRPAPTTGCKLGPDQSKGVAGRPLLRKRFSGLDWRFSTGPAFGFSHVTKQLTKLPYGDALR